jgi:rfaE bifunctional protein kinase chain/domain
MKGPLLDLIDRIEGQQILVVGDVCLDEYLIGKASRLSREAPVPVLEYERRTVLPGAAANPARNVRALGGSPAIVSIVGDDEPGKELCALLASEGVEVSGMIAEPGRTTTMKTRVMADLDLRFLQQVVRLDRVSRSEAEAKSWSRLMATLESQVPQCDAVLVSDYRSGIVSNELIAQAGRLASSHGKPIAVDSQGDLKRFRGYTLVRSNKFEAEASLGRVLVTENDFRQAVAELLELLGAAAIVITRGADGLSAGTRDRFVTLPAANRSEVFDHVGAGDTVISVLALSLAAGGDPLVAAELANLAAGIVVKRFGNAVTSREELREAALESLKGA